MKRSLIIAIMLLFVASANAQNTKTQSLNDNNIIFTKAEHEPEFPGGIKALYKFIGKNLKWPSPNKDIQGTVYISFVVEKNGKLSTFKILKGIRSDLDAEALRVLKLSPAWKPAIQNKHIVRCEYVVPVKFQLTK